MTWHVYPVDDLDDHNTESSICKCDPSVVILDTGDLMVVHNAFDGREGLELANRILKPQIENDGNETH